MRTATNRERQAKGPRPAQGGGFGSNACGGSQPSIHEDHDGDVLRVRHQARFHLVPLARKVPEQSRRESIAREDI
jgi:hypothetical protein